MVLPPAVVVVPPLAEKDNEVSPIVTVELVATIVPEVDPVLTCSWKLSDPSVVVSFANVSTTDPALLVIIKFPVTAAPVKSDVLIVPETVFKDQYKVVASGTLAVVTVNVTLEPSFTEAVDGDTEYVGGPPPLRLPNPKLKPGLDIIGLI